MLSYIASLIVLASLAAACTPTSSGTSTNGDSSQGSSISSLLKSDGAYSSELRGRQTTVVYSQEELDMLWERIHSGTTAPPAPRVDFTRESVVMATSGEQSTGGYSVTIERIEEVPEGMRVVIVERAPGASCVVSQAFTTPVHVVRTARLPGVILFEWVPQIYECD